MTLAELKDWLGVVSTLGVIISFVSLNWLRQQFVSKADMARQIEKMEKLEARVTEVETDLEHVPDRDTAHRLEMAIAKLDGRLELLDERLKPVAQMSNRMQEYLMDEARTK